ncbi:MAG: hypothetical protein GY742_14060 [Hyphomicrobiales bacterium]|nr:hypothetical protein [Hyphomicrobiales bacterium]
MTTYANTTIPSEYAPIIRNHLNRGSVSNAIEALLVILDEIERDPNLEDNATANLGWMALSIKAMTGNWIPAMMGAPATNASICEPYLLSFQQLYRNKNLHLHISDIPQ